MQEEIPELSISSVVATSRCPVRFFLEKDSKDRMASYRYSLAKQVSYHLGGELDEDQIWDEACLVDDNPDLSLRPFLSEMVRLCRDRGGFRQARDVDVSVRSKKYRISGIVDRIFEDEPYFSVVRSSTAPSHGVYAADRLRICGFAICLSDQLGDHLQGGEIEYVPSGISRRVIVEPRDKRRFLYALNEARRIVKGGLPRRPLHPPCEYCPLSDACEGTDGTRLSDIL